MNLTTESSTPLLLPELSLTLDKTLFQRYATIDARLRKGHDYVAWIFLTQRHGFPEIAPQHWLLYRLRGSDNRRTVELAPD